MVGSVRVLNAPVPVVPGISGLVAFAVIGVDAVRRRWVRSVTGSTCTSDETGEGTIVFVSSRAGDSATEGR